MADLNLEEHYAERADKLADTFRALTATLATSGIGLLASKYLSLDPDDEARCTIRLAIVALSVSIIALGFSLQLQKMKALVRRDMIRETKFEFRDADAKQFSDAMLKRHRSMSAALFTLWFRNELYDAAGFYGIVAAACYVALPIEPGCLTFWILGGFLVLACALSVPRTSLQRIQRDAIAEDSGKGRST
jgi:hypothetical protein